MKRFFAICLLLVIAAAAAGCVSRTSPSATTEIHLSEDADVTYNYLVFQDLNAKLNRATQLGGLSPAEMRDLRRRAVEALNKVLAVHPTPELYRDKAALFWNEKKAGRAARPILQEGLRLFPDDQVMTMYLANSWLLEGQTARAAAIMDEYLKRKPDDLTAREKYGFMLVEVGRYAEGLDQIKQVPSDRYTSESYFYKARAQSKLGQRKQAIISLKRSLLLYPEFVEGMAELAYLYELDKDYDLAEKTYTRLLALDGGPEVRLRLININVKLNNLERALDLSMEGPKTKVFLLDAANIFISEGFYAQASAVLDVLAGQKPIPAEYWFYKAVIANEGEKDPAKALKFLEKVTPEDAHYAQALQFRAQLLNVMGRRDDAWAAMQEGLKLFPNQSRFYVFKAHMLSARGDREEALKVLETGVQKVSGDPEIYYELGMLLENMDRRDEAMKVMENLLQEYPDHARALNYVGYTLAEEGRDLKRALVLVENAVRQDPGNGFIIDSLAWVYFKLGQVEKAWGHIRDAVAVENDSTIWEHYGDIAKALGKKSEARKGYKNSLKYNPANPAGVKAKIRAL